MIFTIGYGKIHVEFNDDTVKVFIHQCKVLELYYDRDRTKYILKSIKNWTKLRDSQFNKDIVEENEIIPYNKNGTITVQFNKYIKDSVDVYNENDIILARIQYKQSPDGDKCVVRYIDNVKKSIKRITFHTNNWKEISKTDYVSTDYQFK